MPARRCLRCAVPRHEWRAKMIPAAQPCAMLLAARCHVMQMRARWWRAMRMIYWYLMSMPCCQIITERIPSHYARAVYAARNIDDHWPQYPCCAMRDRFRYFSLPLRLRRHFAIITRFHFADATADSDYKRHYFSFCCHLRYFDAAFAAITLLCFLFHAISAFHGCQRAFIIAAMPLRYFDYFVSPCYFRHVFFLCFRLPAAASRYAVCYTLMITPLLLICFSIFLRRWCLRCWLLIFHYYITFIIDGFSLIFCWCLRYFASLAATALCHAAASIFSFSAFSRYAVSFFWCWCRHGAAFWFVYFIYRLMMLRHYAAAVFFAADCFTLMLMIFFRFRLSLRRWFLMLRRCLLFSVTLFAIAAADTPLIIAMMLIMLPLIIIIIICRFSPLTFIISCWEEESEKGIFISSIIFWFLMLLMLSMMPQHTPCLRFHYLLFAISLLRCHWYYFITLRRYAADIFLSRRHCWCYAMLPLFILRIFHFRWLIFFTCCRFHYYAIISFLDVITISSLPPFFAIAPARFSCFDFFLSLIID